MTVISSLILHIGAHKTGTTAVQLGLRNNPDLVASHGWEILLPDNATRRPANFNFMFTTDATGTTLRPRVMANVLDLGLRMDHNVILSAEDLFFLDAPGITQFSKAVRARYDQVHLVAYLRRQDRMALAHWYQSAKTRQSWHHFPGPHPLRDLSDNARRYLDYATRLEHWLDALSPEQVTLRNYRRDRLVDGDSLRDFLVHALGAGPPEALPRSRREHNAALTCEAVSLVALLRKLGASEPTIKAITRTQTMRLNGPKPLPDQTSALAVIDTFASSNQRLAKMAGVEQFFDDDVSDYPPTSQLRTFTPREALAVVLQVLDSKLN